MSNAPPEPGYTTRATVVNVLDGDTVDLRIEKTVRCRLLDCWAPEIKGKEKPQGVRSKAYLNSLIGGKEVVLHVPGDDEGKIANDFTFGRALGRIYLDGRDVSEQMVKSGYAMKEKP